MPIVRRIQKSLILLPPKPAVQCQGIGLGKAGDGPAHHILLRQYQQEVHVLRKRSQSYRITLLLLILAVLPALAQAATPRNVIVLIGDGMGIGPIMATRIAEGGPGRRLAMDTMPEEMPLHLEAGTGNEPSYHGLLAALNWAEENPLDKKECSKKLEYLKCGLKTVGAGVIDPSGECTPVVSFNIPGHYAADVGEILTQSYDIICRNGLHCAPKIFPCLGCVSTVRLSLSRFTSYEELDETITAVKDINDEV
jgi:hypothetical protein